jgi:hypothetical protein
MPIRDSEIRPIIMGSILFITQKINSNYVLPANKKLANQKTETSGKQDEEKKCVCKNIASGFYLV